MNKNYFSDIIYIVVAIALVALATYLVIAYATTPVSELPTWVALIFFGRN